VNYRSFSNNETERIQRDIERAYPPVSTRARLLVSRRRRRVRRVDAHWPLDVIEALLPAIDEVGRHLALHLPPGVLGNRDTAGFGDALDTSRDIHAIAKNVVALDDDVADVDANSELDRIGFIAGALLKLSLNFDGAGHRVKEAA